MKRINKAREIEIDTVTSELGDAADTLNKAIEAYNKALAEPRGDVETAMADYNEKVTEAKAVFTELAEEASEYYDNHSERWQEGEAGQAYYAWKEHLENALDVEEVDIDLPDEIEIDWLFSAEDWERPALSPDDL